MEYSSSTPPPVCLYNLKTYPWLKYSPPLHLRLSYANADCREMLRSEIEDVL